MALYNILYSSVATKPMNDKDLADLMLVARRNNQQQAITGLMLYHHGSFMQIIEGDEYRVKQLFEKKIYSDPRHRNITVYIDCEIEQRTFPDWSMGFLLVEDDHVRRYPGYSEFLENGFDTNLLLERPTVAKEILTLFSHEQELSLSS